MEKAVEKRIQDIFTEEISEIKEILKLMKENKATDEQVQGVQIIYQNLISEREKIRKRLRKILAQRKLKIT